MTLSLHTVITAAMGAAAAFTLVASTPAQAAAPDGKALFQSTCASCHDQDGHGGKQVGKAVAADLRSPRLEDLYDHSDALLLRAILQGIDDDGDHLDVAGPHYQGTLTQEQAQAIVTYMKTLCCRQYEDDADDKSEGED